MNNDHKKWIYLIVLAMVWGSSFITGIAGGNLYTASEIRLNE